ncbi:MAG TPA: hypothetical protein VFJ63_01015 [Candidatus Bathyarchaeia archaeon]|nr:hypothetical protein [Candidatus Bathyarchaeia archaeon]
MQYFTQRLPLRPRIIRTMIMLRDRTIMIRATMTTRPQTIKQPTLRTVTTMRPPTMAWDT